MGKRSSFKRIEKDYYRTIDPRAVNALLPHLEERTRYVEPCAGDGTLIEQLDGNWDHTMKVKATLAYASDIEPQVKWVKQQDALTLTSQDLNGANTIITNPPWSRHILHPMIDLFSTLKPTWLLFDSDWMHTIQSARYMRDLCTDVVSVGRLIWIPGTKTSGKDNCCWYRFDANKRDFTTFHGRTEKIKL